MRISVGRPRKGTLTTHQACTLLGLSRTRVLELANDGTLPCTRDEDGARVFKLADVQALARRRGPRIAKAEGSVAQQVFELFHAGMRLPDIVIRTGHSPAMVRHLWEEYCRPLKAPPSAADVARAAADVAGDDKRTRELDEAITQSRMRKVAE